MEEPRDERRVRVVPHLLVEHTDGFLPGRPRPRCERSNASSAERFCGDTVWKPAVPTSSPVERSAIASRSNDDSVNASGAQTYGASSDADATFQLVCSKTAGVAR